MTIAATAGDVSYQRLNLAILFVLRTNILQLPQNRPIWQSEWSSLSLGWVDRPRFYNYNLCGKRAFPLNNAYTSDYLRLYQFTVTCFVPSLCANNTRNDQLEEEIVVHASTKCFYASEINYHQITELDSSLIAPPHLLMHFLCVLG